jgi:hypothetical protein
LKFSVSRRKQHQINERASEQVIDEIETEFQHQKNKLELDSDKLHPMI